jgi:uncharacterized membrane protein YhiD involved in acid resistance
MHGFLVTTSASNVGEFAGRAAVALVLGGIIGVERQWRQRMAGLRTNVGDPIIGFAITMFIGHVGYEVTLTSP